MNRMSVMAIASAVAVVGATGTAQAQSIHIENAIARVVYMPEDRADIAIEVQPGSAALPVLQVRREGRDVRIDGQLDRNRIVRSLRCQGNTQPEPPRTAGEGASASLGRVQTDLSAAPLIVVRGPREVDVRTEGGVFGAVGRGATDVRLSVGRCGDWVVGNVDGDVNLRIGGSGNVWTGRSEALNVSLGGSGDVRAAAANNVVVRIGGSGDVRVREVNGNANISIAGSGDVVLSDGRIDELDVRIAGSGDVRAGGVVKDLGVSIVGSGDVSVDVLTGNVSRRIIGSGEVRIGGR